MKKVVVIGPESTGKSTLSEMLAKRFHTAWTPEYAREYIDQLNRPYEQEDLLKIAQGQLEQEKKYAATARELLICDTDLYVIKVWSEHKYADCDHRILQMIAEETCDLYLLTHIDMPWEEDPQREYPAPEMRAYFYNIYKDIVMQSGVPFVDIHGSYEQREMLAVAAVEQLLQQAPTSGL
ncbi:NadR type nicotinamide-nucleotide adenylyltransferase [Chitinophaga dinghuensis]|uniref:NadR type nicotinamide-nucleotide adenylyltransferase n=1 Tax=Chitinophaga dinghuensis TaxID=1539050 RepID=A0A327W6A4_9BACT|nr:ATP-binding protein [Chitinophaga dinghuensis]RAJ85461.1 NadR type nicotinamide-nucleotide adenylyltransferase [Chitinophaga dinghuensis]